jgi:hypothetical protein
MIGGQRYSLVALPPGKGHVSHCTGGWVAGPGPIWTVVENLASTGIRIPNCPARSMSFAVKLRNP